MESRFSEEMMDIRKDLVTIHGEMVLLKNYSALNFAGTENFHCKFISTICSMQVSEAFRYFCFDRDC